jgi:cellulose synthase/poly-beta-1,6-N-acetylglucosamine synthase-like glycosyltransferase
VPALSVLLPVRNAGRYLGASLASLARQTFRDFEVVAVDDGSSDGSGERLDRAARRDPRIRVLRLPQVGLPAALNAGLAAARGRRIARHDADDLSHSHRFERQWALLEARPEVAVVGCRVRLTPREFAGVGMRRWAAWHNALLTHEAMAREVLIDSPLCHGTALMRRDALEGVGGWREASWPEDVDLWVRLIESGARLAKVPRILYAWRQHPESATRTDSRYRREAFDALRLDALRRGALRGVRRVQVVGVGASLERWRALLAADGRVAAAIAAPRPGTIGDLAAPAVLVFGAAATRARWRAALSSAGWVEGADFVFVA